MWSTDSRTRHPVPEVKRSQHGAEWYSAPKLQMMMELRKHYKFVHNKLSAVRFGFQPFLSLQKSTRVRINFLFDCLFSNSTTAGCTRNLQEVIDHVPGYRWPGTVHNR